MLLEVVPMASRMFRVIYDDAPRNKDGSPKVCGPEYKKYMGVKKVMYAGGRGGGKTAAMGKELYDRMIRGVRDED